MPFLDDDEEATPEQQEAHERRITRCSCGMRIILLFTERGKKMPVEADTVEVTDTVFVPSRHRSHFADCPNAGQHRRAR